MIAVVPQEFKEPFLSEIQKLVLHCDNDFLARFSEVELTVQLWKFYTILTSQIFLGEKKKEKCETGTSIVTFWDYVYRFDIRQIDKLIIGYQHNPYLNCFLEV